MEELDFPDNKNIYKISEAAALLGVKPYVLRYWETEFQEARPRKSYSGQRVYNKDDIKRIFEIKSLLYSSRYSIAGAREVLKQKKSDHKDQPELELAAPSAETKAEMQSLKRLLKDREEILHTVVNHLKALKKQVDSFEPAQE